MCPFDTTDAKAPLHKIESALLIDDNQETLRALGALLHAMGVKHVRQTSSAENALEILKGERFSIILSDYMMEGMDGVAFCSELRSRGDQTPLVLLSGAPDKVAVLKAIHFPKVDFFGKPFTIAELTGAMERLMAA